MSGQNQRWSRPVFLIMPAIYVGTIAVTCTLSIGMPGGACYRIFGLDPLAAMFGMVYDNAAIIIGVFLLTGTPWWYFVGWFTFGGERRVFGGVLALFTVLIVVSATLDPRPIETGCSRRLIEFSSDVPVLAYRTALFGSINERRIRFGIDPLVTDFLSSHD